MRSWWMGLKVERLEFDSFFVCGVWANCVIDYEVCCVGSFVCVPPSFLRLVLAVDRGRSRKSCTTTFSRLCFFSLQIGNYKMPTVPVYYIRNR